MATKPVTKKLNTKQKEILARKLGYDGPMNMFEEFIKSDPAMSAKYSTVVDKYMARGGMAKKYAKGGVLKMAAGGSVSPPTWNYKSPLQSVRYNPSGYAADLKRYTDILNGAAGYQNVPWAAQAKAEFGTAEAYLNAVKAYDTQEQEYTLAKAEAAYNADPNSSNNIRNLANAYTTANQYLLPSSRYNTIQKEIPKLQSAISTAKSSEDAASAAADVAKKTKAELTSNALKARDALYSSAASRRETTIEGLRNQQTTQINAIFAKNDLDEKAINDAYAAGQISQEQRTTLRNQIQVAEDTAVAKIKQDYDTAKAAVNKQFEDDYAFADKTYTDIIGGSASPTATYTLPQVAQTAPTLASSYTPLKPEQLPTVEGTPTPPKTMPTPIPKIELGPQPTVGVTGATDIFQQEYDKRGGLPVGTELTAAATTPPATTATGTTPPATTATTTGTTTPSTLMSATPTMTTVPKPEVPTIEAATVQQTPDQLVSAEGAPAQAATVQPNIVGQVATAAPVAPKEAATIQAATATPGVATALQGVQPVTGTVSPEAQVQAQTMEPTSTKVSDLTAATGEATMVQPTAPRTVQEGELVAGPTVDMGRVEEALTQNIAAQGEVTPEMTVAGQLQKLTADFDATNPPPWASGAIRSINAELARRGVGASSMAGQALLQTALESALPIAAADAKVYQDMGIQNLSNRQQMAVLTAQQRAAFLGQEFDQAFQTRVTNAATISEIANINFTAEQQIALENARLTNTVNLANLSNQQALIMAEAAQIANLETANLNNRQQAAVLNAQAFLQMDMANLANEQQTELFKAQSVVNSLLTDSAAENAARQFNASSINQVNQFYDGLTTQIQQFNATQTNAMNQFNVSQVNTIAEFNATTQNARDQFNAEYRRIIDQSNAEWRRNIALADTAAINRANEVNAANALGITTIDYNNQWQTARDIMEMSWKTGESALDRENQLAMQVLAKQAQIEAAKYQVEVAKYEALGSLTSTVLDKSGLLTAAGGAVIAGASSLKNTIVNAFSTSDVPFSVIGDYTSDVYANDPAYGWQFFGNGTENVAIDPEGNYWGADPVSGNYNMIWSDPAARDDQGFYAGVE